MNSSQRNSRVANASNTTGNALRTPNTSSMNNNSRVPTTNTNVAPPTNTNVVPPPTNVVPPTNAVPVSNNAGSTMTPEMVSSAQEGGKKRSKTKKVVKKPVKETTEKKSKSKKTTKGGSIAEDIKNLAVPFALLLAKEGVKKIYEKKQKK